MTISSTTKRNNYDGNGTTNTYAYSFKVFDESHLKVIVRNDTTLVETTLTLTTHYTTTGIGDSSGGTIVLVSGSFDWLDGSNYLKTGYSLTIRRVVPLTQLTDIRNQGNFFPEVHEDEFDLLMMAIQQQQDDIDRSLKLQETSEQTGIKVPDIQPDKAIFGKSDSSGFEWRTITATSGSYPGDFDAGLDASKASVPSTNDMYIATDTKRVYVCFASGTWTAVQLSSGADASKQASPLAGELYVATDTGKIYICKSAGTWVNQLVGIFNGLKGSDIASASSIDLGAATGNYVDITGTTTITSLGTADAGINRKVQFDGALTLTHDGTSLILPTGANITTAAGDTAEFVSLGSGNWKCLFYQRVDGTAIVPYTPTAANALSGSVIQTVITKSSAVASSTGTAVDDDSIPTLSECPVISALNTDITASSSSNTLIITAVLNLDLAATNTFIVCLFLDSSTAAIAAARYSTEGTARPNTVVIQFSVNPSDTSAHTYKIGIGGTSGGVATVNGNGGSRKLGGVLYSSVKIEEIKA